jgi:hypothetical protein
MRPILPNSEWLLLLTCTHFFHLQHTY